MKKLIDVHKLLIMESIQTKLHIKNQEKKSIMYSVYENEIRNELNQNIRNIFLK